MKKTRCSHPVEHASDATNTRRRERDLRPGGLVQYSMVASGDDLYRLLINEVPETVKRQARALLRRSRGESTAAHQLRLGEINRHPTRPHR